MDMNRTQHQVISVMNLSPGTFLLRIERNQLTFEPGQYVILREPGKSRGREYSIYSSLSDAYLDFLIREVDPGQFSKYLHNLLPGSFLELEGPKGFFILNEEAKNGHPLLFVATGTGISPFHSFIYSFPTLNYRLLHGVRFPYENYGLEAFSAGRLCLCTSQGKGDNYHGRVSTYLRENPITAGILCYLCGNSSMIEEVTGILEHYGLPPQSIHTEIFF